MMSHPVIEHHYFAFLNEWYVRTFGFILGVVTFANGVISSMTFDQVCAMIGGLASFLIAGSSLYNAYTNRINAHTAARAEERMHAATKYAMERGHAVPEFRVGKH